MKRTKVSVVMPVFNTEAYVTEALKSIIHQDLHDIEIIIINDGSTDNSLEIIQALSHSDSRIHIHSQENKGLSESRNYGIKAARGEYIYFMDSDDLLASNTLSDCYKKCKENNLDFNFFDAKTFGHFHSPAVINYQRTHLFEERVYEGPKILDKLLSKNVFLSSACLNFINLAFLRKINLNFYPGILHEDELFTLLLFLQAKRVSFIPYPYFQRRIREKSIMTSRFSRKNANGYFTVARELIHFQKEKANPFAHSLIEKRLKNMFKGILYKTRSMKINDRIYVLNYCITNFNKYISLKDMGLALAPFLTLKRS